MLSLGWAGGEFATAADPATNAAARARLERIQNLRKERPNDVILVFYEAITRLGVGEQKEAFALLRSLKGRKLGLIPARGVGFDEVWNEPEFVALREQLATEEPRTPDAPVAFRLADPKLIPEGIAYDATGDRFFIGSIAQRKIVVTDGKGPARDFSRESDQLDAILGLAVDPAGKFLYAVSTNGFEESAQKERRNAVVRYDLASGRLLDRFPAPEAVQLNDLALAPDGTVYATDSAGGTLLRKLPNEKSLNPFGENGGLRGANGIAFAPEGRLYVTLSTGIARIESGSGEAIRLPQPDDVVTGGIDGLYWHGDDLIGVQNTTNPGRVVRIALGEKGLRIRGLSVLQSHQHPELDEPTTGAIGRGAFHLIANSYVGHYQPNGTIKNAGELKETTILAIPLRSK